MVFCGRYLKCLKKYRIAIDMITTSEVAVSLTIDTDAQLDAVIQELQPFGTVDIDRDQAIISVVGNEIAQTPDVLKKYLRQ